MIYKNKDSANSNLFGDKKTYSNPKPVDPTVLESFSRKQTQKKSSSIDGDLINKTIIRSSSSSDMNVPGEIFTGKDTARSIFNPEKKDAKIAETRKSRGSEFMKNVKQEIPQDIEGDLLRFKGNFSNSSKSAGSHEAVRSDRISIFDTNPFERIEERSVPEVKTKSKDNGLKISKNLKSSDVLDSLWSKISDSSVEKKTIAREIAIDKIFGDKNG